MQERDGFRKGEGRALQAIVPRVDGVVLGAFEGCFPQVALMEEALHEIRVREVAAAQVRLDEAGVADRAAWEACLCQLQTGEVPGVDQAVFEAEGKEMGRGLAEIDADEFALAERHATERTGGDVYEGEFTMVECHVAEVGVEEPHVYQDAVLERAIRETALVRVRLVKGEVLEDVVLIFRFCKRARCFFAHRDGEIVGRMEERCQKNP